MGYALVVTAVVGLVIGFAGGFLTFTRSHVWCRKAAVTTYRGAEEQLAIAQEVLDRHGTSIADGVRPPGGARCAAVV